MQGKIVKGIAGFYYVVCKNSEKVYECKAKGVFRHDNSKPLVGDDVEMDVIDEDKAVGNIVTILKRKNELIRPAAANIDMAVVIFSIKKPDPNFNLLDRFLIMMEQQNIPCVICFNKEDIDESKEGVGYVDIYKKCGYQTVLVSAKSNLGIDRLKEIMHGKTAVVAGPSGVGKSSVINCLQDNVQIKTGAISVKIERGKHTTRHTEIIPLGEDTYILDTPGFSSLALFDLETEDLWRFFPEFKEHEVKCRFTGCAHINEPVCGIKDALKNGEISSLRYGNYKQMYEELKERNTLSLYNKRQIRKKNP